MAKKITPNWPKIVTDLLSGRTQTQLADLVGCRQSSIRDWKFGIGVPSGAYAVRLWEYHKGIRK